MARSLEKTPKRASNIDKLLMSHEKNGIEHRENNRFESPKQGKEKPREKHVLAACHRLQSRGDFHIIHRLFHNLFLSKGLWQCSITYARRKDPGSSCCFSASLSLLSSLFTVAVNIRARVPQTSPRLTVKVSPSESLPSIMKRNWNATANSSRARSHRK